MLKKYKKELLIFLLTFLISFILGLIFTYYLNTYNFWNVVFDIDTPRVYGDIAIKEFNHYRASVHPLFIIIFQPLVHLLNIFTKESVLSVLLLQSLCSAVSVLSLYLILKKMNIHKNWLIILTLLFAVSFGQIVFSSNIETYIFAQVFLLMLWLFVLKKMDKKLKYWDYVILVLLGIGSLAVTITNFIQFIIAVFFLVYLNPEMKNRFFTSFFICLIVGAISVLLAEIQNMIWPSAPNFFTKIIGDLIHGTSEEALYINKDITFNNFLNIINSNFAYSFNIFKLFIPATGVYVYFEPSNFINWLSVLMFLGFVSINGFFMYKTKVNIKKHKFYYALLLTYIFNFVLHIFYGNSIAFLYVCHYNFIIILLLAYVLNYFKVKVNKCFTVIFLIIISILSLNSIFNMFKLLSPIYNPITYMRILPILIISILLALISILLLKKKFLKVLVIIICLALPFLGRYFINDKVNICKDGCSEYKKYELQRDDYIKQLKDMKNSYSVRVYSEVDEPIGIYYFGMADRQKMLYKNGKLIDIKTKKVIKEIDYKDELIIPNEYTVVLKDEDDNLYKIVENEKGIYFYENDKEIVLSLGKKEINLPEFDNYKFSEILKVLHQEILFNIDGDIPKPNIFGYKTAWYRDAMLATMVLEITENTSLLEDWLLSVDKIYDNSRDSSINEADNLGELLYIIGAVDVKRNDLVNKILKEIEHLKGENSYISGMVDGSVQSYYPTVLALYGAQKNNIQLDLIPPTYDDAYAKLTWYYNNKIASSNIQESSFYPYINWAFYHYANYGLLYILDEIYPLSYEGGNTEEPGKVESECFISNYYCERNLYISHMWHASEMFLFLKDY